MIIPLMKPNEWEFLQSYLHKDQIMLEYGSGRSTAIISGHVQTLYSVEHDAKWHNKVSSDIKHLPNINYFHVPPNVIPKKEKLKPAKYEWFVDYINWPKTQDTIFDVVLIDGRARQWVAESILDNIRDDSFVFIHDYGKNKRPRYDRVLEFYDIVASEHTMVLLKKKEEYVST